MGFAIAEYANSLNAKVLLISGPVNLSSSPNIHRINVESAEDMYKEVIKNYKDYNIIILSAAVADFTPQKVTIGKIKKETLGDSPIIQLVKTKDILKTIGELKTEKQILIGFALESENLIENAKDKLIRKNCDLIVANHANKPNSGFGGDYNTITFIGKNDYFEEFLPMTKLDCAKLIIEKAYFMFNQS